MPDSNRDLDLKNDQWVWVVVQDPEKSEQLLGQQDAASGVSFIPTFMEKEDAQLCLGRMARDKKRKYEVQAIILEDLRQNAAANNVSIFILDDAGTVLKRI